MDYVYFILITLILVAIIYFLNRSEKKTKNKHKKEAYRLLDTPNPDQREIISTIKCLRLYGGRWRKDQEFIELIKRLAERLAIIEGPDKETYKSVRK
jgi:cbb3-type cytochrome oxidase subunit 3